MNDENMEGSEVQFARKLREALRSIETIASLVSYGLIIILGLLYYADALNEMWVIAIPALELLALKAIIGGYYGAKVAPRVIREQKQGPPRE